MPIVKSTDQQTLKVNLPKALLDELFEYAKQVNAPRSRVVRIALERLFDQDDDWDRGERKVLDDDFADID